MAAPLFNSPLLRHAQSPGMFLARNHEKRAPAFRARGKPGSGGCKHDRFVKARQWVTNKPEYVNMADINANQDPRTPALLGGKAPAESEPVWDLIELLF